MKPEILDSIEQMVNYLYADEERCFLEDLEEEPENIEEAALARLEPQRTDAYIFSHVVRVAQWLESERANQRLRKFNRDLKTQTEKQNGKDES